MEQATLEQKVFSSEKNHSQTHQEHVVESPYITKEQRIEIPPLPFDGGFTLVIRPVAKLTKKQQKEVDSHFLQKQRNLYFDWVGTIGDHFGNDKPSQHVWLKQEMLLPVLESESEEFAETMLNLRTIYNNGSKIEALHIRKQVANLVSVSDKGLVTRKIMWLYMEDVHKFAMSENLQLKMPIDYRTFEA